MRAKVCAYAFVYAVLMGFWYVAQQKLFALGVSKNAVLFWSGLGMSAPIFASLLINRKLPQRSSIKWFVVIVIAGIVLAECLVGATEKFGAALGANAMGLAPVAAIFVGWIQLRELPGRRAVTGILAIFVGVYILHLDTDQHGGVLGPLRNMWGPWLWYTLALTLSAGLSLVWTKKCIGLTDSMMAPGIQLFAGFGLYGLVLGLTENGWIEFAMPGDQGARIWCGVLCSTFAVANCAQAEIYRFKQAASVGALKRLSLPMSAVLAWWFFDKQPNLFALLIGSSVICVGAILIGLDKKNVPNEDEH